MPKKGEVGRADRIMPGVWRLRLPIRQWPGVPHVNAFAIASGSGVVLVDTGLFEPGSQGQLERALDQAGLSMEHVRLLVCTHAHSDHYGMAAPIVEASGAELWMHPNHEHMTKAAKDPDESLDRRIEVARQSGVPEKAIEQYESRRGRGVGIAGLVMPHRDLVAGVEIETDLGTWQVHETPGHAPSHVVLHQPERGLLLSGDHLIGRVSLYYDYGWSPDPAGEYLSSLDTVEQLDASLCLAGHGRPFRDVRGMIEANRSAVTERIEKVRAALDPAEPKTAYEIVPALVGENASPLMISWGLNEVLVYLQHLENKREAAKVDADPERWTPAQTKGSDPSGL